MKVTVISETIQEFNGKRYYRCGNYFQRKGVRLHRTVWEYHHGPIPSGYDVHHKTHDRNKNDVEDLELQERGLHLSYHSKLNKSGEAGKEHMKTHMIPKAVEWHKSEEGRKWHSENAKKPKRRYPAICEVCGTSYETAIVSKSKFCSGACKARNLRRIRRECKSD